VLKRRFERESHQGCFHQVIGDHNVSFITELPKNILGVTSYPHDERGEKEVGE